MKTRRKNWSICSFSMATVELYGRHSCPESHCNRNWREPAGLEGHGVLGPSSKSSCCCLGDYVWGLSLWGSYILVNFTTTLLKPPWDHTKAGNWNPNGNSTILPIVSPGASQGPPPYPPSSSEKHPSEWLCIFSPQSSPIVQSTL